MSQNIIQLLPDNIANQIAAGEVVSRPSSAVKELLENAIDANSTEITLNLKDGGKSLIQVIDNGKGMTDVDARMSFERHATSKIRQSEDLFDIKTMGFRGEALASIAAVAQVEMITRSSEADVAFQIQINGSEFKKQQFIQGAQGTSITVKNLFFNVPARRKFLKSDHTEYKHVMDEFHRIVLANPNVKFVLFHNNNEIYHLKPGNLKQRIIGVFGKTMQEKLVPLEEKTEILGISGFIVKPQFAKKSKGEQYLFVNQRFIKSHYLNHAIRGAFENLITSDQKPGFFIYLEINPGKIDINVHPTKQEIKFAEERLIYNYIKVAVRHALGRYNLTPMLDFEHTPMPVDPPQTKSSGSSFSMDRPPQRDQNLQNWQSLYDGMIEVETDDVDTDLYTIESKITQQDGDRLIPTEQQEKPLFQIHNRYIISPIKTGFMVIDQVAAHERIIFEDQLRALEHESMPTQKVLFPETIELSAGQAELLKSLLSQMNKLGFDIQHFGQQTFLVHGTPVGSEQSNIEQLVLDFLEDLTNNQESIVQEREIAKVLARKLSINRGRRLTVEEMQALVTRLFKCETPYMSPSNRNVIITIGLDELQKKFQTV